jgi:hypothetical protein
LKYSDAAEMSSEGRLAGKATTVYFNLLGMGVCKSLIAGCFKIWPDSLGECFPWGKISTSVFAGCLAEFLPVIKFDIS